MMLELLPPCQDHSSLLPIFVFVSTNFKMQLSSSDHCMCVVISCILQDTSGQVVLHTADNNAMPVDTEAAMAAIKAAAEETSHLQVVSEVSNQQRLAISFLFFFLK